MLTPGMKVSWKAAGKVARLEGLAGKRVSGKLLEIQEDGFAIVLPDHRTRPGAAFPNLKAVVEVSKLSPLHLA